MKHQNTENFIGTSKTQSSYCTIIKNVGCLLALILCCPTLAFSTPPENALLSQLEKDDSEFAPQSQGNCLDYADLEFDYRDRVIGTSEDEAAKMWTALRDRYIYTTWQKIYSSWDALVEKDSESLALFSQLPERVRARKKQLVLAAGYIMQRAAFERARNRSANILRKHYKDIDSKSDEWIRVQVEISTLRDEFEYHAWAHSQEVVGYYLLKSAQEVVYDWHSQKDPVWHKFESEIAGTVDYWIKRRRTRLLDAPLNIPKIYRNAELGAVTAFSLSEAAFLQLYRALLHSLLYTKGPYIDQMGQERPRLKLFVVRHWDKKFTFSSFHLDEEGFSWDRVKGWGYNPFVDAAKDYMSDPLESLAEFRQF